MKRQTRNQSICLIASGVFALLLPTSISNGSHPMPKATYRPNLEFTAKDVNALLGKRVLIGVTHRTLDDAVASLEEFHGEVVRVNLDEGMVVMLPTGAERSIPPDLSRLEPASPGEYRLKSTGEVVVDPDFTVMWTVYPKGYRGGLDV